MLKAEGSGAVCSSVYFEWIIEWIFWKYSIISNFIFLRKNDWQKEGYPVYYVLCSARAQNNKKCASGSVGGARPCQGRGRGFESRLALFSCKGISDRISLFAWKEPWRAQNRIHRILFEVSEDIKSSSVGAKPLVSQTNSAVSRSCPTECSAKCNRLKFRRNVNREKGNSFLGKRLSLQR